MMAPAEKADKEKKKKGILERLPRLSRTSQTILILAMLVAMFVPTYLIYYQQPKTRAALESSLATLQKVLAAEQTPKERLEADLKRAQEQLAAARALYPDPNHVPELVNSLIGLAEQNDIDVTETKVTASKLPPPKDTKKDKAPAERIEDILTAEMTLKGQVSHFQNFLLALDKQFPTIRIKKAAFTISSEEGKEDTCTLSLLVFCYPAEENK